MREEILTEIRILINQIPEYRERFGNNDIRASFLDGYFQTIRTFFCSYYHLETEDIMTKYQEIYQRNDFNRSSIDLYIRGHKNILNSFLIINSWSNFELCITLFVDAVLPIDKKNELLAIDYNRLHKIFKDIDISEDIDQKLRKYIKFHLVHVPINNKYGKLFKLIKQYPKNRDKKQDIKFLDFFGRLRNCIHSNYIYYGREQKEFKFSGVRYQFLSGKLVSQKPAVDISIFQLTRNLKQIFMALIENIEYGLEIYDPSIELIE